MDKFAEYREKVLDACSVTSYLFWLVNPQEFEDVIVGSFDLNKTASQTATELGNPTFLFSLPNIPRLTTRPTDSGLILVIVNEDGSREDVMGIDGHDRETLQTAQMTNVMYALHKGVLAKDIPYYMAEYGADWVLHLNEPVPDIIRPLLVQNDGWLEVCGFPFVPKALPINGNPDYTYGDYLERNGYTLA